jgi:hypothetical protein
MNVASKETNPIHSQEVCTIVVLYDGNATRSRAMAACNYLVQQFWADIELKFHWWRTDFLRDAPLAAVAADNAVTADFLIIATENEAEISPALESWFESWLSRRMNREGALVDLRPAASVRSVSSASQREHFLLEVCERGSFDYLAAISNQPGQGGEPGPLTKGVSGVIDEKWREPYPPSHYGLNE